MGKGRDIAALLSPEGAAIMENFRDQLLIILLKRLGGKISIPVKECDDTGGDMMMMSVTNGDTLNFEIRRKNDN